MSCIFLTQYQVSEVEDRQMNISETRKCYVYGQCQVSEDYPYIITKFCVANMKLPFPQGIFP